MIAVLLATRVGAFMPVFATAKVLPVLHDRLVVRLEVELAQEKYEF